MRRIATVLLLVLGVAALVCGQVSALDMEDITNWVGSGDNEAAMVIEWSTPEYFNNSYVSAPIATRCMVWGYRFNGAKTGEDMFNAILAADSRLYAMVSGTTQYGKAVFAIGYDLDDDGDYGITNGYTTYDQNNFVNGLVGGYYSDPDDFNKTGSGDLYWGGWYGPNWELWHELGGNGGFSSSPVRDTWEIDDEYYEYGFAGHDGDWEFSEVGMSGLTLHDGSWMGWSVAAGGLDYGSNPPTPGTIAWFYDKHAPGEPVQ